MTIVILVFIKSFTQFFFKKLWGIGAKPQGLSYRLYLGFEKLYVVVYNEKSSLRLQNFVFLGVFVYA